METSVQQLSVLGNSVETYLVILPSDVSHVSSFHEENIARVRNVSHLAQLRQNIEELVSYHEFIIMNCMIVMMYFGVLHIGLSRMR